MKIKLLQYINCTACSGDLEIKDGIEAKGEIKEGRLLCKKCNKEYKIFNFIPRFVDTDDYVDCFSLEWANHSKTQLDSFSGTGESERTLRMKTGFDFNKIKGKLVLDAGCGMGRFSEIIDKYGGEVVGFDLSYSVDQAFANLGLKPGVHFIQADIYDLPFKKEIFDYIFSAGVMQHTPNAQKAFGELPKLLKNGGELAISIYSDEGLKQKIYNRISKFWRFFTIRIPQKVLYKICYIAIPLYHVKKRKILGKIFFFLPISMHPTPEWRVLDTFNWYSPKYQSKHTFKEVEGWFENAGLKEIKRLNFPIAVRAKK